MAKKLKFNIPKINWLNHSIGFVSVLAGVLIAFGLNNWNERVKQQEMLKLALVNIKNEIIINQKNADTTLLDSKKLITIIKEYLPLVDDQLNLVVSPKEWEEFATRYPNHFDSNDTRFRYTIELFKLSRVAWETSEKIGIMNTLEFKLALDLAETYSVQSEIDQFDKRYMDQVVELLGDDKRSLVKFLRLIQNRQALVRYLYNNKYPVSIQAIDDFQLRGK